MRSLVCSALMYTAPHLPPPPLMSPPRPPARPLSLTPVDLELEWHLQQLPANGDLGCVPRSRSSDVCPHWPRTRRATEQPPSATPGNTNLS
ncbi:hypothetical protein SCP_1103750 [Sparassis crispa]|uniref:Uncharacterized protein n=1 Tax=Sparassis crispa TaxID=139825 RepID=A0A401GZW2_9APHY|nr:hypothetical protein SCP_1103750 [Sparassis crispa]GBE87698.1 hypothetical protein SCP_1103750 [Sparassis crispa]